MRAVGLIQCILIASTLPAQSPNTPSASPLAGRPVVVFIHGRAQQDRDPIQLTREWYDAFRIGIKAARLDSIIGDADLQFVWYGDLYRPGVGGGCMHHESLPYYSDIFVFAAVAMRAAWDTAVKDLSQLLSTPAIERRLSTQFVGDVEQYLSNQTKRCETDSRLMNVLGAAAVEGRPVVLVAHSLGSLISYSLLVKHQPGPYSGPAFDVTRFVTVGSMLGLPSMPRALLGSHQSSTLLVPAEVASWVNIRNASDSYAFDLASVRSSDLAKVPVEILIANKLASPSGHSISNYLTDPMTARVIVSGWCKGFSPAGSASIAPANCLRVPDVP